MRRSSLNAKLGELLLERGLIDEARLAAALAECEQRSVGLAVVLVETHAIEKSALLKAVGEAWKLPSLDLESFSIDPSATSEVTAELALRCKALPLDWEGGVLRVGMANPLDLISIDDIKVATGRECQPVFVYETELERALEALESPEALSEVNEAMEEGGGSEESEDPSAPRPAAEPPPPQSAPAPAPAQPAASAAAASSTTHASEPGPAGQALGASAPPGGIAVVDVFYATDRHRRRLRRKPDKLFSGARNRSGGLHFGRCEVSIPAAHVTGQLERPAWYRLEFRENVAKHVVIGELNEYSESKFFEHLRMRIDQSSGRDALVFVHGYNVSFGEAVRRTAQLAYDLDFEGAAITYSWPSRAKLSGYLVDENNVTWSVPHLESFLLQVRQNTGAETVHLIAHSMGSRALTQALTRIAARPASAQNADFRQVVLAAPDIDADVFRDLAPKFAANVGRTTLYASSKDEALKLSSKVHGGYPRAGQTEPEVVVVDGVDTIDASAVATGLGHSYYGTEPTIVSDLYYLLRKDTPPDERHRLEPKQSQGLVYWELRG